MPTATTRIASSALQVPPTQNTAQVIEFNCLYTHDIRRKSKRWQDGFLRLHTFNARALVYDEQRNLVGDTHLTDGKELEDGDEIRLDKGGVLVQVADRRGESTTDLTGVCKQKTTANPASSSPLRLPEVNVTPRGDRQPLQEKHRSLNALLGPKRKPLGKAVLPSKSPFQLQQEERESFPDRAMTKRRRLSRDGEDAHRATAMRARAHERQQKAQAAPPQIDLISDDEGASALPSIEPTPATPMPRQAHKAARKPSSIIAVAFECPAPKRIDQERSGKRLSIAKANPKRNMLACQSMAQPQTIEEQQRQRVVARLARLEQQERDLRSPDTDQRTASKAPPSAMAPPHKPSTRYFPAAVSRQREQRGDAALPSSFEEMDLTDHDMDSLAALQQHNPGIQGRPAHIDELDFGGFVDAIDDELNVPHEQPQDIGAPVIAPVLSDDDLLEHLATSSTLAFEDELELQAADLQADVDQWDAAANADTSAAPDGDEASPEHGERAKEVEPPPLSSPVTAQVSDPQAPVVEAGPAPSLAFESRDAAGAQAEAAPKRAPVRRSKRVGRVEIRKSAAACFKPPTLSTRVSSGPLQLPTDFPAMLSTHDKGPWSREACDLFTWRPPGWNEAGWCIADPPADSVQ